ncbi:MAG: BrnT family toxin [Methylacidiphilales bacterium]|nr:BrnT family toxin [Candidatus Methylacidiphilales bacterium]
MGLRFEWDDNKDRSNLLKHSVSFAEASTVFGDPNSITISDAAHSLAEARYVILGRSYTGKLMVVVHTERGENIRIISARAANRRERRTYEENF